MEQPSPSLVLPGTFVPWSVLIHPGQVNIAGAVFGPSADEVDLARRIAEVDGRPVEHIHATAAERTLALARVLAERNG